MATQHTHIAIIGASFAGLSAYLMLRKRLGKDVDIKIFDMRDKFSFTPGYHECLGDPKRLEKLQFDLKKYYSHEFIQAKIQSIQHHKEIITEQGESWTFDYAVVATGSRPQFFNNPSWQEHGYTIRYPEDIPTLNQDIPKAKRIAVIGGGITGVEVASVIKQRRPDKHVTLIHSGPQVLHTMGTKISTLAHKKIIKMGVNLHYGQKVKDLTKDTVLLNNGDSIPSDLTLVSAGVTADDEAHHPHLTFDNRYTALECDNIYLAGDVAMHGLLPTAHNAFFEGRRAGNRIADKIEDIDRNYPKLHNWTNLAIALGTRDGIMTFGKRGCYVPYLTGFLKRLVEKRVLFEFKYKIMLPV